MSDLRIDKAAKEFGVMKKEITELREEVSAYRKTVLLLLDSHKETRETVQGTASAARMLLAVTDEISLSLRRLEEVKIKRIIQIDASNPKD